MKRFLFGIATSITLLCIGSMLLVFELKDYRMVSAYSKLYDDVQTYEAIVDEEHPLRIDLEEDVLITYDIDDDMKENVELDVAENIEHTFNDNRLRISNYRWFHFPFGKYIDVMTDGLKEKKIYYFNGREQNRGSITIRCSEKTRDFIRTND